MTDQEILGQRYVFRKFMPNKRGKERGKGNVIQI